MFDAYLFFSLHKKKSNIINCQEKKYFGLQF